MESAAFAISGILIFLLLIGAGIIVLQIFLSKGEKKWPGLILPGISFGISLLTGLGVVLFTVQTTESGYITEEGEYIMETVTQIMDPSATILSAVYIFLIYNIPTVILLAIYAVCREKRKKQRALEIEKMSVQDL